MIIGRNFYFIHNPKSAGTSVRKILQKYAIADHPFAGEYQVYIESLDRTVEWFHLTAADARDVLPQPNGTFRFGFVRNPYDRFFSSFNEHCYQHQLKELDINQFILQLDRMSLRYDWRYTHLCPQHYFFYVGNRCVADFIGRFERLDQDWSFIQRTLGMEPHPLGRFKKTDRYENYRKFTLEDLSEASLKKLDELYSRDFDLFGYQSLTDRVIPPVHASVIERFAGEPVNVEFDISSLSLGEQCAYWRAVANGRIHPESGGSSS